MPYLIAGCGGRNKGPQTGAYVFDINKPKTIPPEEPAFKQFALNTVLSTPRKMFVHQHTLYTVTRQALFESAITTSPDSIMIKEQAHFPFSEIRKLINAEDVRNYRDHRRGSKRLEAILDELLQSDHMAAHVALEGGDLLLSMYTDENFKEELKEEVDGGFFIRFKRGTIKEEKEDGGRIITPHPILEKDKISTGDIVKYQGDTYYTSLKALVSGRRTRVYAFRSGNILATAVSDDGKMLVMTNNRGDYKVIIGGQELISQEGQKPEDIFTNPLLLPSEATSTAIARHQGKAYLLFGLDDGKIRIYQLPERPPAAGPRLEFIGTVNFLSLEEVIERGTKDNHVKDIQVINYDTLFFSIREGSYKLGLGEAIRLAAENKGSRDRRKIIPSDTFKIPHRTTTMAIYAP